MPRKKKLVTIIKCRTKLLFLSQNQSDYCILIYLKITDNDVDSLIFRYTFHMHYKMDLIVRKSARFFLK